MGDVVPFSKLNISLSKDDYALVVRSSGAVEIILPEGFDESSTEPANPALIIFGLMTEAFTDPFVYNEVYGLALDVFNDDDNEFLEDFLSNDN